MHLVEVSGSGSSPVFDHFVNLLTDPHDACGLRRDGLDLVALSLDFTGLGIELGAEDIDIVIGVGAEGSGDLCTFALGPG